MAQKDLLNLLQERGINILLGLLVLIAGIIAVNWVTKLCHARFHALKIEPTLKSFLRNLIKLVLYVIVVVTAASIIGIPMATIIAVIASAGVAVSLAMQGALSNLIGGLMLLILKPIKAGEYVKVSDFEGTVQGISAFYTDMLTADNRHISIPNSNLTNTPIINYTREGFRRLETSFSVSYSSSMDQVMDVLKEVISEQPLILSSPAPEVHLKSMGESSLEFITWTWFKCEDYWTVFYYMRDEGKRALDRAGIQIPFPQLDVHIK